MPQTVRWISVMGIAGVLGLYVWEGSGLRLKDRFVPRHFVQVEPTLFRSGQIDRHLIGDVLRDHDIDTVIDLQGEGASADQCFEKRAAEELGVDYQCYSLNGRGLGELDEYGRAVASVANAVDDGRRVLVHCAAGARRTGGVLAVYELLVRGDADKAREELERYTGPGDESMALRDFINENRVALAHELVALGVLHEVPAQIEELADSR